MESPRKLIVQRVVAFFQRNDGETLETADIAAKFDVPAGEVPSMLARAVGRGWLARDGDGVGGRGRQSTYRLGPTPPERMPNEG